MLNQIKILEKGTATPLYCSFVENLKQCRDFLQNAKNSFGSNCDRVFATGFVNDHCFHGSIEQVIKQISKFELSLKGGEK